MGRRVEERWGGEWSSDGEESGGMMGGEWRSDGEESGGAMGRRVQG